MQNYSLWNIQNSAPYIQNKFGRSVNTGYLYPEQCFSHTPDQQHFDKHVLSRACVRGGDIRTLL